MIGYLQIQNFILSDKDRKISKILISDFKTFCSSKNLKVLNLFNDSFHNGKMNDMKVFSIRVFNEYLKKDKRLIALFNNSYSCTENFYKELQTNELTKMFIKLHFDKIYEHILLRNKFIAEEFLKLKSIDVLSKEYNPYLCFVEEFIYLNERYYYEQNILKVEKIYEDFVDYVKFRFKKDTPYELDPNFINEIKNVNYIKSKYQDILFRDNLISNMFNILAEDNNNKILFNKLKKKYFKRFIINKYPTIDLNLLNNYEKSELFHNNMIIYLTKNQ